MISRLLEQLAIWMVIDVLSVKTGTFLYEALIFFIADVIKIFLMLFTIIYIVSILRSFLPPEKTKNFLSYKRTLFGNILAAGIGVATPF